LKLLAVDTPNASSPISRAEVLFLSAILILALSVRLPQLERGLELDEIDTAYYAIKTSSIWQTMSSSISFNNHIGYSLAARFSQDIFGRTEWAFRLPALLYGLASLYVFWIFTRSLLGPAPAALATLLFAQSPVHILWSISGRGYSGMILFTLLSSCFYLQLLQTPSRRRALAYIAVGVFGIYTHLYSALVIVVQFVYLGYLYVGQQRKPSDKPISKASFRLLFVSLAAVTVLSMISYAPALPNLFRDLIVRGRSSFDPAFPWAVIGYLSGSQAALMTVAIAAISVIGLLALFKSHPREAGYLLLLLLGPLLLVWLARPFDLYPRFFCYWLPYYLVFLVAGLRSLWHLAASNHRDLVRLSTGLAAAIFVVVVLSGWSHIWPTWVPHDGFRDASQAIVKNADDSVAFCAIGGDAEVFRYYLRRPVVVPVSMADFWDLIGTHREVRCLYYQASWESPAHTQIARFLQDHGSSSKIDNITLFIYP